MANVPLFIKAPRQEDGRIVDSHVRTLDVLPTVADFLDLELPWKVHGRSLRDRKRDAVEAVSVKSLYIGKVAQSSFVQFRRERDALVSRKIALFGAGDGSRGIYASGPERDLIGKSLDELEVASPGDARVQLDAAEAFRSVDPRAAVVPAMVTGHLAGVGDGDRLAVAVNGRVQAVTQTFDDLGQTRFSALIPPAALRSGSNRVEVLAIQGIGAGRKLATLKPEM